MDNTLFKNAVRNLGFLLVYKQILNITCTLNLYFNAYAPELFVGDTARVIRKPSDSFSVLICLLLSCRLLCPAMTFMNVFFSFQVALLK